VPTIFVQKSDRVTVTVYAYDQSGKTEAVFDKNEVPNNAEDVQELGFVFRRPTYADSFDIIRGTGMSGVDLTSADLSRFSDQALRTLLVDWDISEDGKKVPFSKGAISRLHPSIARAAAGAALDAMGI
jgi:hypothetical protein